jgi:hypothetical protein
MGFCKKTAGDSSKPDTHPRHCLSAAKADSEFGFKAKIDLREGPRKTFN